MIRLLRAVQTNDYEIQVSQHQGQLVVSVYDPADQAEQVFCGNVEEQEELCEQVARACCTEEQLQDLLTPAATSTPIAA
jgi:hypothetical protein